MSPTIAGNPPASATHCPDGASPPSGAPAALMHALAQWRQHLGEAHVITGGADLRRAGTATFATAQRVSAILRPESTEAVAHCLRIATRHGIAVYPVSGGMNWGFGSRVPCTDAGVLLDLARMNRIVDFSEALSYVTVEPGVSFAQIHDWLSARGSRLYASTIGGPPQASLIGNALERGDGDGPYGDRGSHVAGLEVVLASGEVLQTGFARFPGARTAPLHPHGVGPGLEQLFLQSNLGVVTRMSLPLARQAELTLAWYGEIGDVERLPALMDALRDLVQRAALPPNAVALWNGWKLQARSHARTDARADPSGGPRWHCSGLLEAFDAAHLACLRALLSRQLGPVLKTLDFSAPGAVRPGVPGTANLRTAYWGKPPGFVATNDLDRDRCGLLWLCPSLPFDGEPVRAAMTMVQTCAARHGFEPHVGMSPNSARLLNGYVSLVWDRDDHGADARARACHDELLARLIDEGHLPYRLGLQSMTALPPSTGAYDRTVQAIKSLLDPQGTIAPGRYAG